MLINTCMSFSGKCPCLLCQHPREECAGDCPKTYGKIDTSKMCDKAKDYCEKAHRNMINNDLISRSALIAEYDRVHVGAPGGSRKLMQDAPAVEAVEVVHARWIDRYGGQFENPIYVCSACDEKALYKLERDCLGGWHEVQALTPVCPYCGAKMYGERRDHD